MQSSECMMHADQYVEAMLGIGQVHIEEARLEAGVLVPALDNVDSDLYKELNQEELEDLSKAQGRDANAKLKVALKTVRLRTWRESASVECIATRTSVARAVRAREAQPVHGTSNSFRRRTVCAPQVAALRCTGERMCCVLQVKKEDVQRSEKTWAKVYEMFRRAEAAAAGEKSEKTKEREASRAEYVVSQPYPDETHLMKNQVKIIWGNALYDQSQIWAGLGLAGWKEMVTDARAHFLDATCKERDVLEALRNHIRSDELDLPEEEKPAAAPAAEASGDGGDKKAETGAKGLPSLKGKKKKPVQAATKGSPPVKS
jgi:hypothetical protein